MRRLLTSLATATLTLGLGVGLAAPAEAARDHRRDPARDVVRIVEGDEGSTTVTKAPRNTSTDITRFLSAHLDRRVNVKASVRNLVRRRQWSTIAFKTGNNTYYAMFLYSRAEGSELVFYDRMGTIEECPGIEGGLRFGRDQIWVSVPRRCLDRPRWVRTGMSLNVSDGGLASYSDDARDNGYVPHVSSDPTFGGRIY